MINLKILEHPLIKMKLTIMRNKNTNHIDFRNNLNEIASLMVYEILRNYKTKKINIETSTGYPAKGDTLDREIIIVPILRAGLGMVDGILNLVPQAKVGHIGLYRNEKTLEINKYFYKMPSVNKNSQIIIVDPMLATGKSSIEAIKMIQEDGFHSIKLVCLVACPEGIKELKNTNLNVEIYVASLDEKLNKEGYIVPGLGDAGDRIFGTK